MKQCRKCDNEMNELGMTSRHVRFFCKTCNEAHSYPEATKELIWSMLDMISDLQQEVEGLQADVAAIAESETTPALTNEQVYSACTDTVDAILANLSPSAKAEFSLSARKQLTIAEPEIETTNDSPAYTAPWGKLPLQTPCETEETWKSSNASDEDDQ
jgi:hypothetical protein